MLPYASLCDYLSTGHLVILSPYSMNAAKTICACLTTFIALILVGFIGSPTLHGFPSTIVYKPNCDSWAPVYRWERLSMTDWNTPMSGASIASPDPAPEESGPVRMILSHRTIDDEFQGMVDLTIDGLSLGQSVLLEKFKTSPGQEDIDTDSVLLASSLVTDGAAELVGEVYNSNLIQDIGDRDGRLCTLVWTDAAGQFKASVTADRWGALVRRQTVAEIGYIHPHQGPLTIVDTTRGDVMDLSIPMSRANIDN